MDSHVFLLDQATLLVSRLERLSADSTWAHRASGLRGTLMRMQEQIETGRAVDTLRLQHCMEQGYKILEGAAKEKIERGINPPISS